MYIPNKSDFQPSSSTLKLWLSTRKPMLNVGGVQMPGYFSDMGNSIDANWFLIAVLGEIIGFFTTLYGGYRSGGVFLLLAILSIIMFIFCDFFFAVKLHRKKTIDCQLLSRKLLLDDTKTDQILAIDLELKQGVFIDFLLQLGIIFIAVMKIFGIILLNAFNNLILYIPFAIIYFIVAYVHIRHTGYYFAYFATERAIEKEFKLFAEGRYKVHFPKEPVILKIPLTDIPIKHAPHEIICEDSINMKYTIKATGVLTDEDIINLISGQDSINKITLFKACRTLQLGNYN